MKYVVIVSILLSYTNFFYAAEELSSREKSSCKMRFLYLPTCCRISQEDYYRCWCDAAGKDKNNIVAGVEFLDQFDQKKILLSTQSAQRTTGITVDPYTRFLMLSMGVIFKYDQEAQMELRNSGRRIARPFPLPKIQSLEDFYKFQFRAYGPKTLTLTKQGRREIASFVMQHDHDEDLLQHFIESKKIDPDCKDKIQKVVEEFRPEYEGIKAKDALR